MSRPRSRISPATLFFFLLSLGLGIALYIKTRPPSPAPRPEAAPSPRLPVSPSPRPAVSAPPIAVIPTSRPSPVAPERARARVAIVIDDLGNDAAAIERIAQWPYKVSGAVLPVLPGSSRAAGDLERSGKQVLLHLPMEPRRYPEEHPGPGLVLRSQSEEQIASTLETDLESVPGAAGVSNHMGSAATADVRVMRAVARVLARRRLFFLDSRTTGATVAREVALEQGVPSVSRRVFLDDVATEPAVSRMLEELLAHARADGFAVGIGHPYPATFAVLERELPKLDREGIRLVPVGELAR